MSFQAQAQTVQHAFCLRLTHSAVSCHLLKWIHVEVAANEKVAGLSGQATYKVINDRRQLLRVDFLLHISAVRNTVGKLGKGRDALRGHTFAAMLLSKQVNGYTSGDLGKICRQYIRPVGRHRCPRVHICIVHAFLTIFLIGQNIVRNGSQIPPVFLICLCDGGFTPLPV